MGGVVVITDSTSCIPRGLLDSLHIRVVPIILMIGGKEYRDGIDITPKEAYSRMRKEGIMPTTSGNIVAELLPILEQLRGKVDGAVIIVLSPDFPSMVYNSALQARKMVPDLPIEVIDSRMATASQALVVLAAARAAAADADMAEVVRVARETIPKVNTFFAPEDLKYFKKTGRFTVPPGVPEEQIAQMRPILTFRDGGVRMFENASRERAIPRILELVKEKATTKTPLHVIVFHSDALEEAEKIKRELVSNIQCAELLVGDFSPVTGAHVGPGALGVAFYNE